MPGRRRRGGPGWRDAGSAEAAGRLPPPPRDALGDRPDVPVPYVPDPGRAVETGGEPGGKAAARSRRPPPPGEPPVSRPLICVFAGARPARDPAHAEAARAVVDAAFARGLGLVYGGGGGGMMGVVAEAAVAAGVHIVGVAPRFLVDREVLAAGLSELVMVDSMAERKQVMFERGAAFLTLPGGIGTFDEFFEVMSANYLDLLGKPCGVFNVNGYFDPLVSLLDTGVESGFIGRGARDGLVVEAEAGRLVDRLTGVLPPEARSAAG